MRYPPQNIKQYKIKNTIRADHINLLIIPVHMLDYARTLIDQERYGGKSSLGVYALV